MATKITLRRAKISGGRESLYLDYYPAVRNPETMKLTRKETLDIYIFQNPKTQLEKDYNKETLYKAEIIRCIRLNALINEEYGFLDKGKQKRIFLNTSAPRL